MIILLPYIAKILSPSYLCMAYILLDPLNTLKTDANVSASFSGISVFLKTTSKKQRYPSKRPG